MSYTSRITREKLEDMLDEQRMLLEQAIARSISHTEIVHLEFPGDGSDLVALLNEIIDVDFDLEWVEVDGVVDCWVADPANADQMLWRLNVTVSCGE